MDEKQEGIPTHFKSRNEQVIDASGHQQQFEKTLQENNTLPDAYPQSSLAVSSPSIFEPLTGKQADFLQRSVFGERRYTAGDHASHSLKDKCKTVTEYRARLWRHVHARSKQRNHRQRYSRKDLHEQEELSQLEMSVKNLKLNKREMKEEPLHLHLQVMNLNDTGSH